MTDDLTIRPARQARTRASWERVLEAGARLLEDEGYEGFTISAVCERADVSVATIYARAASKDALFLAVYDHVLELVQRQELVFDNDARWAALPTEALIREAVAQVAALYLDRAEFFRAIVLISGAHAEVRRRGTVYARALSERFAQVLLSRQAELVPVDAALAVDITFRMLFSSLAIYVSYGPGFGSSREVDHKEFVLGLQDIALAYLLHPAR